MIITHILLQDYCIRSINYHNFRNFITNYNSLIFIRSRFIIQFFSYYVNSSYITFVNNYVFFYNGYIIVFSILGDNFQIINNNPPVLLSPDRCKEMLREGGTRVP